MKIITTLAGLNINESGALNAQGSADNKIIFTSEEGSPGTWHGISFNTSNDTSSLDYIVVDNGGRIASGANEDFKANIIIQESSTIRLTNSEINNSSGYGIVVGEDAAITDENNTELLSEDALLDAGNTFEGNADGAVKFMP